MNNSQLHIVSFNIPYPADYGGVIDVFYKLKALKNLGIKINLHCFEYGRKHSEELKKYCENVYYYKRKKFLSGIFSSLPYIVNSRQSELLMKNLLEDNAPILFEGLHTCFYLNDKRLKNRFKIYRESNIEHEYYHHLSKSAKNFFKKIYFNLEAYRLKKFEKILSHAKLILPVSTEDEKYFKNDFPNLNTVYLPSFHPNNEVNISEGKGEYILYHGNLSVGENKEAAMFLIKHIFSKIPYQCIIAGLNPDKEMIKSVNQFTNIKLVSSPNENEMNELIKNAQINLLITFQPTGLKLKLLSALFAGRYCLVNSLMLAGTDLNRLCEVANEPELIIEKINSLMKSNFDNEKIETRKSVLDEIHSNQKNAELLMKLIHY